MVTREIAKPPIASAGRDAGPSPNFASKFMQDEWYPNRAWAKWAGLPARETGRCERSLSEALRWRLWV
ncbi:hypothetical protein EDB86DRAFT_2809412, partial [Lactarius hatsudake]